LNHNHQHELYLWTCSKGSKDLVLQNHSKFEAALFLCIFYRKINWNLLRKNKAPNSLTDSKGPISDLKFHGHVLLTFFSFLKVIEFLCQSTLSSFDIDFIIEYQAVPLFFWTIFQVDQFLRWTFYGLLILVYYNKLPHLVVFLIQSTQLQLKVLKPFASYSKILVSNWQHHVFRMCVLIYIYCKKVQSHSYRKILFSCLYE
jgi:hypothetical protein